MAKLNRNHWHVFDKAWFKKHQQFILSWVNGSFLKKKISRKILQINTSEDIIEIGPDFYIVKLDDLQRNAIFYTHAKFSKIIYHSFFAYWWFLHFLDWIFIDRFIPEYSFGLSSLVAAPGDGSGVTCDGYVARVVTAGASWTSIRTGTGTTQSTTTTAGTLTRITCHVTDTDKFYAVRRAGFSFDTSELGVNASISNVVLSIYSTDTYHVNTYDTVDDSLNVVSFTPADVGDYVGSSDFNSFGSKIYCTMSYADYTASNGFKNFTLDVHGRAIINKLGISVLGIRVGSDISGTGLTWKADADIAVGVRWVDYTGTASDPYLTVTYTTATYKPSAIIVG